jgi:hypothetical protein
MISLTSCINAAVSDNSLQLAFLQALLSPQSRQDGYQGDALTFRPLCSVLPKPVYSMSPSRVKKRKKGNSCQIEYIVVGGGGSLHFVHFILSDP